MKSEKQRKSKCPAGTGPAVCETRHITGKTGHAWLSTRHGTVGTRHVTVDTWIPGKKKGTGENAKNAMVPLDISRLFP